MSLSKSWRALSKSALCSSGGKPQLLPPNHLRLLNTAAGGGEPAQGIATPGPSTRTALALVLGGTFLGLCGYYAGARPNSVNVELANARALASPSPPRPVYGTPEDFSRAIEELRATFVAEAVATARDQLDAHGFSPNSYHPGTSSVFPYFSSRAIIPTALRAPT